MKIFSFTLLLLQRISMSIIEVSIIKLMVWKCFVLSVVVLAVQPTNLKFQGAKPLLPVPFHHIKALSPASIAHADLLNKFSHTDNISLSIL